MFHLWQGVASETPGCRPVKKDRSCSGIDFSASGMGKECPVLADRNSRGRPMEQALELRAVVNEECCDIT